MANKYVKAQLVQMEGIVSLKPLEYRLLKHLRQNARSKKRWEAQRLRCNFVKNQNNKKQKSHATPTTFLPPYLSLPLPISLPFNSPHRLLPHPYPCGYPSDLGKMKWKQKYDFSYFIISSNIMLWSSFVFSKDVNISYS